MSIYLQVLPPTNKTFRLVSVLDKFQDREKKTTHRLYTERSKNAKTKITFFKLEKGKCQKRFC